MREGLIFDPSTCPNHSNKQNNTKTKTTQRCAKMRSTKKIADHLWTVSWNDYAY